jgi:hypothetical protein
MERKSVMVKEYATRHEFNVDELKLSREGWSVDPPASPDRSQGLLTRIRARLSRQPAPVLPLVVTYRRGQPL